MPRMLLLSILMLSLSALAAGFGHQESALSAVPSDGTVVSSGVLKDYLCRGPSAFYNSLGTIFYHQAIRDRTRIVEWDNSIAQADVALSKTLEVSELKRWREFFFTYTKKDVKIKKVKMLQEAIDNKFDSKKAMAFMDFESGAVKFRIESFLTTRSIKEAGKSGGFVAFQSYRISILSSKDPGLKKGELCFYPPSQS